MSLWYKIKKAFIQWFADIRVYNFGLILWGDSHYKVKGNDMRMVLKKVLPGDIILRRYNNYLGSVMVKGHFSHAAVYVGDDKIVHMLGDGITWEDILVFMHCDDIAIMRPSPELAAIGVENAYEQLAKGVKYDFDFDTSCEEKFYCTEFVDYCYNNVISIYEEGYVLPDDFLDSEKLSLVWRK
ncbi:MAG: hypothetical protein DRP08_04040 [Candidatus Aenigmatarchaeota archaeon]|nr:MAG: hypothetical protein DRP08_04040 [Candidatus Aenigmarchaeota archaeon]